VSSGGSSYVCILASTGNAVSNGTYWNIMSSAGTNGTNGTDVGTTLTTQGDILYRDGSGLQRLPKGTANQELRINSGATAPEWYTPVAGSAGKILQVKSRTTTSVLNTSTNGFVTTDNYVQITPSATSSKVYVSIVSPVGCTSGDPWIFVDIYRQIGTGSFTALGYSKRSAPNAGAQLIQDLTHQLVDTPNTTLEVTYKAFINSGGTGAFYNGRSSGEQSVATGTAMEIGA
jgi:hypothetical protein